jgi:glycosyltransferase involved in cell wall biosynthesis
MVSVIVPVYQVSDYVERCIRSVMAQTYTDIECIIVDDATRDDSIDKCEALIKEYDGPIQFRIIHHEQNRGLSVARNTGFDAANGEYVYFLDSDDYITPDCIEKLVSVVKDDPTIEMVQGNSLMKYDGK